MKQRADVPTRATEEYCPWTVALFPDVTIVNVIRIAITGHCVVMVPRRSSVKGMENDEQYLDIS